MDLDTVSAKPESQGVIYPYPQGTLFPLGLYSIQDEMFSVRSSGWNLAQTYRFEPEYVKLCSNAGFFALAHVDAEQESAAKNIIEACVAQGQVGWWDLPEEQRYWIKTEYERLKNIVAWTRRFDHQKRPNYMYLPGHYPVESVTHYVPYLDVIGVGVYPEYSHQPRAWVRWRVETIIGGIERAGYKIGPNYIRGEKTPVAVLQLFWNKSMDVITFDEAYHDFYSAIVSKACGILIFSYWHRNDHPSLIQTWEAYNKAAAELTGKERLDNVVLYGEEQKNIVFEILEGDAHTRSFEPWGLKEKISYPSLNILAKIWRGDLYLLCVNSSEEKIYAEISGIPSEKGKAEVLFKEREVSVENGAFSDYFGKLGINIYRIKIRSP